MFFLLFSVGNYLRLSGIENIKAIQFFSIFVIGALSGVLIFTIVHILRNKSK